MTSKIHPPGTGYDSEERHIYSRGFVAGQRRGREERTREILDRLLTIGDGPPDFDPVARDEIAAWIEQEYMDKEGEGVCVSGETMVYVGFAECGCPVAATVDGHPETAKDVAQFIRDGLTVERKTVEWVRENLGHRQDCAMVHKPRQESLL